MVRVLAKIFIEDSGRKKIYPAQGPKNAEGRDKKLFLKDWVGDSSMGRSNHLQVDLPT